MLKLTSLNLDNIDDGLYDLEISYYTLSKDKKMGDGAAFKAGTKVRKLLDKDGDGLFFVETIEEDKSLFWVGDDEADFLESRDENWASDDIKLVKKFILNDFL